ncbi:hypothetical protein GcC1_197025 [Golovinomyces cichoracearum]|uniref:Uncharacterized protein n=1 Tax=Golovinomyces cichoracearum TaxID=62708 RepID=A0A420HG09_9PEZI|nr:hypothetical protein GcC1_197025 [Golovinomyces cichoracearum]
MSSFGDRIVSGSSNHGITTSGVISSPHLNPKFNQPPNQSFGGQELTVDAGSSITTVPNFNTTLPSFNSQSKLTSVIPNTSASSEINHLQKEILRLKNVLAETSAEAAQAVLREQWRDFIFAGSDENHIAFVVHAVLKHVGALTLDKVFQDESLYRSKICDFLGSKGQMISRVLQSVTNEQLTSHVPELVLNKALAERVKYVPARDLINWLACADRLGYKSDDILNDEDESVIPNVKPQEKPDSFQAKKAASCSADSYQQEIFSGVRESSTTTPIGQGVIPRVVEKIQGTNSTEGRQQNWDLVETQAKRIAQQQSQEHLRQIEENKRIQQEKMPTSALPSTSSRNIGVKNQVYPAREVPNYFCSNCKIGFTQKAILEYHIKTRACWNSAMTPNFSQNNLSKVPLATSTHIPDTSNTWPSWRASQYLPVPAQPPVVDFESSSLERSHDNSQSTLSSSQSLEMLRNKTTRSRQPSLLNASCTTETSSTASPQLLQPSQNLPLSSSNINPGSNELNRPSINPSIVGKPSEIMSALKNEVQNVDETLKKEMANLPPGLTQDQRISRINSLVNTASMKKFQIGKSYGAFLGIQEDPVVIRDSQNTNTNTQAIFSPTIPQGLTDSNPPISSAAPQVSNSSSSATGAISTSNDNNAVNGNSYSGEPKLNSQPSSSTSNQNTRHSDNDILNSHPKRLRIEDHRENT